MILFIIFGVQFFGEKKQIQADYVSMTEQYQESFKLTKADQNVGFADAAELKLTEQQKDVAITEGGSYRISGEYRQTLYINAEEEIVHLLFDNVNIHAENGPALYVISAGKVIITLMEGTDNLLKDAPIYPAGKEAKGAVYSTCDLTINGKGRLSVYGFYEDGIYSRDVLKLLQGEVYVQAKKDALRGSDGVLVELSKLEIESERNGIVAANTGKEFKGTVDIGAGEISIVAGEYGIVTPSIDELILAEPEMVKQGSRFGVN